MGPSSDRQLVISAAVQRTVLFVAGLALLVHEAVARSADARWPLLVVYAGMMGVPLALKADEQRETDR